MEIIEMKGGMKGDGSPTWSSQGPSLGEENGTFLRPVLGKNVVDFNVAVEVALYLLLRTLSVTNTHHLELK